MATAGTLEKGASLLENKSIQSEIPEDPIADPIGVWISGGPGTGKTSLVRDIAQEIESLKPGSVGFIMAGKSGGFFQGVKPSNEIIICDEFNWEKLKPDVMLSLISPQEALLNQKNGEVFLRRKKLLIVISNFDLQYYMSHKEHQKLWTTTDPVAVIRRFITIELGNPSDQDLLDVSVAHKGAYAL